MMDWYQVLVVIFGNIAWVLPMFSVASIGSKFRSKRYDKFDN